MDGVNRLGGSLDGAKTSGEVFPAAAAMRS